MILEEILEGHERFIFYSHVRKQVSHKQAVKDIHCKGSATYMPTSIVL
jgi:hypothetical protein